MSRKFKVRLTEQEFGELLAKSLIDKILGGGLNKDSIAKILSGGASSNEKPSSNTSGSVESRWMDVTKKVIDNFEGGYWNYWECKNHPWHSMYKKSGETMFGLDRKAGEIEKLGPDGKEFFRIIDDEKKKLGMSNFCSKWIYNYRGGELEERLKSLASKIMYNEYLKNMSNYIKDPETKKRIEGNRASDSFSNISRYSVVLELFSQSGYFSALRLDTISSAFSAFKYAPEEKIAVNVNITVEIINPLKKPAIVPKVRSKNPLLIVLSTSLTFDVIEVKINKEQT